MEGREMKEMTFKDLADLKSSIGTTEMDNVQWLIWAGDLVSRCQSLLTLANRILDPNDLGMACTPEIRDAARWAIGLPMVETERWMKWREVE